ncbi:MAG TPA: Ig-like domain-containing protein, partial [Candidatus Eisenbacteria bacterium]|nr:Ig-like domain-containing protein [Candidatus Eisenbacteria bacterium]
LANDTDVDGDVLSVANGGTHTTGLGATVVLNANGSFSYDAASSTVLQALNDGDSRVDSFTYIASDGHGGTSTQTVTVTVAGVTDGNHAPVAADDAFGGDEDTTISGNVLGNDSDPDAGDTLTVTSVGTFATAHGSVTIAANGDFTYFPAENFFGEDAFDYTIADADGAQSTASVALTVNPVNDLPVAVEDNVTVTEDSPGFSGNVLTNDQSEDTGESLSVLNPGVYETDLGVFDLQIDGSYTYTLKDAAQALAEGGVAVENRLYVIGDGAGNLTSNFLTVTITGVNDAPDAHDDVYAGDQGIGLDIATDSLLANDTDVDTAFSIDSVQDAVNGTVSLSGGVVTFIPDAGFFGDAGFTYTVRDTAGATDTAAVSVHVRSSSDVLHAESDGVFVLNEDDELLIPAADLLVNDTGAGITVDSVGNATHGFVQLAGDLGDQVEFIPDYGFSGQATFDYTITDASGELSTATVTLDYRPVADTPVVFANDVAGVTGENISLLLEANLDDQDGSETLTVLLSNVLPGATFSSDDAGAVHVGTDLTGGLWLFASGDLSTLHVAGLAAGDNVMTLIGIAAENGTDPQLTALASATFHVNVALPDPDGGIPL